MGVFLADVYRGTEGTGGYSGPCGIGRGHHAVTRHGRDPVPVFFRPRYVATDPRAGRRTAPFRTARAADPRR
ncbi:hypothetical protein HEK131_15780 [Streptomyces seoulensis]|nr:hypothetical protein HEK131_15780 [Streptomyces seoulensis]